MIGAWSRHSSTCGTIRGFSSVLHPFKAGVYQNQLSIIECTLLEGMPTWTILYQSSVLQTAVNVSISIFFLLITDQYEDAISDNLLEVLRAGAIAISKVCLANRCVELGSGQLRAETIENVNEDHILYDLLAESSQFQDHIIQFQMALSSWYSGKSLSS